jgi:phosphoesterase, MJ0936 family
LTSKKIAIISDTHGLIRPELITILENCDEIIHGGDIVNIYHLEKLKKHANLTCVRGNCDKGVFAHVLHKSELIEICNKTIYVIHDINETDIDLASADVDIVIYGHSHSPKICWKNGILFINPGSAGPKRFNLPTTAVILELRDKLIDVHLIDLRN